MTAQIKGFLTRADLGMRSPRSVSYNIQPEKGGGAKHYGGATGPPSDHADCIKRWLSWQNYHMDTHGWVDIAYTGGYCDHGYAFPGRGFGVRTAANGTNDSNDRYYAYTWIGGGSATPTQAALDALDWWFEEGRKAGNAGSEVRNHSDFKPTACPGDPLRGYTPNKGGGSPVTPTPTPEPTPVPTPKQDNLTGVDSRRVNVKLIDLRDVSPLVRAPGMKALQKLLDVAEDGLGGNDTRRALGRAQRRANVSRDYIFGPDTAEALLAGR